jgi:hypothetical protein
VVLNLPIGEEDSIHRLKLIDAEFQRAKRSTVPAMTYFLTTCLGGLFNPMIKAAMKQPWPPYLISTVVGPRETIFFKNVPVKHGTQFYESCM